MCVQPAANHLRKEYIKSRFYYAPDEWPPYHPRHYTTLALIHHRGRHSNTEVISVAQTVVSKGNISKNESQSINVSYHSKDISELFPNTSASSYFILIEGAPGIGKTVLSKEIAYQWAENKLLNFKKLVFLLFVRDPNLQKMVTLENLTQYLCSNNKRGSELSEYLLQTEGKDLTIIFDGYDEMSEEDRINSLVAKIISRNVLPECDLVITSRPTASLHLRDEADCRVEVLGFTEEDRLDYIQHALEGSQDKIKVLQSYLQSNSTINALCYVPLNMTILLCLYEDISSLQITALNEDSMQQIGLPTTQTEMYEKFILMTITRCIKRTNKNFLDKDLKISELPTPYNEIFNELLQLAYYALRKDLIVFNSEEEFVQQFYKSLKSGDCQGLGLLKVTKYVSNISFHFLHFSIQEYLAAYYIASLSTNKQFQLLKATFWDIHYFNTWIMYVGISGGKNVAWMHFISGNWFMLSTKLLKSFKISKSILNDKIKSLHLFQCFAEIGSKELVKDMFRNKIIDLSNQTLLPRDISTLCFFLLRSGNKYWIKLDLSNCNVGDVGSDILYKTFIDKSRDAVCIDKVDLSHNILQNQSILELLDVVRLWHSSEVVINTEYDNYDSSLFELCLNKFSMYAGEDFSQSVLVGPFLFAHNINCQVVHSQLMNSTILTGLYLNLCNYESVNSTFYELNLQLNCSRLHIIGKNLPVNFLETMIQTMCKVDSIYIYDNFLCDEGVNYISSLILYKANSLNSGIWVVIGSNKIIGNLHNFLTCNKKLSPVEVFNLAINIRRLCSDSTSSTTDFGQCGKFESKCLFEDLLNLLNRNVNNCEISFCMIKNSILIANGVTFSDLIQTLSINDHLICIYTSRCKFNVTELQALFDLIIKQKSVKRIHIIKSSLQECHFQKICRKLSSMTPWLKELLIHTIDSSCNLTSDLFTMERNNTAILLINSNVVIGLNPTARQLSIALKLEPNITMWLKLPKCHISVEAFYLLVTILNDVSGLDISDCNIGECELQELKQCNKQENCFANLRKLSFGNVKFTNPAPMTNMLSHVTKLNSFNLRNFNIISDKMASSIAVFISQNTELEELIITYSNLQKTYAVTFFKSMQSISKLLHFNISHNCITDEVTNNLAEILSQNVKLKELDLSYNYLQAAGAISIFKGMNPIVHLSRFNISHNAISDKAADDLAKILSHNFGLKELDLSYNSLQTSGAVTIFKGMHSIVCLSVFNISHNLITDRAADDLAELLSHNVELKHLDLSYNCFQTTGASIVLKGIKSILHLSEFNIGHNNITHDIAYYLAEFLSQNVELKETDLSYNCLQAAGAITVFKGMDSIVHLSKLNISHNLITDKAADDLATILSHNFSLQELDLSHNCLQATGASTVFKRMSGLLINLTKLNISNNSITGESAHEIAAVLSQNKFLKVLDVSFNNLGASSVLRIFLNMKNFENLIKLNAAGIGMTDIAADYVANVLNNNTELKELDLSHNNIQAAGAMQIFRNSMTLNLTKLNISHNNITDQAAGDIATFISHNTELEEFDICHNNLQAAGAVKICKTNMPKLIKLNVSHNNILTVKSYVTDTFLFAGNKLQVLDFSYGNLGFISLFKNTQAPSDLSVLKMSNCIIDDQSAKELATILLYSIKLKEIDLSQNNLSTIDTIKVFEGMKYNSDMIAINISHNGITDEATDNIASVLLHNTKLKELNVSHNRFSASGAIKIFKGMRNISNLTALRINHNMITDEAADSIATVLSHNNDLVALDISSNYLRSAGCIKIFDVMTHLTKLDISSAKIDVFSVDTDTTYLNLKLNHTHLTDSTKVFKSMKNILSLKKINFANTMTTDVALDDLATVLLQNTELQELDISGNNLQTTNAIKLFKTIKQITTFTKLNIAHNNITDEAMEYIATVLSNCNELAELNISHNCLHNMSTLDCLICSSLTKIDLSNNNIDNQAVKELSVFLSHCTKVEELNLANNNLQTGGAIQVFKNMTCTSLKRINISGNHLTLNAANGIAFSLSKGNRLQEIDLSSNTLQGLGVKKILASVNISKLTKLRISNNNISGKDLIQYILIHAISLVALDISCNRLHSIANANQRCSNLIQLNMRNIQITNQKATAAAVAFVVSNNSRLQELDISYNSLDAANINTIFKKLNNTLLTKFNANNNEIGEKGADYVGLFLSHNTNLKELNISHNELNEIGTKKLCRRITNLSNLTTLRIGSNSFTYLAADDVAAVLLFNTKLEDIDLSDNNLLATGAISIFNAMKRLSTLRSINISHNSITTEAAGNIATVLSYNKHLRKLYLANNYLKANGIIALCRGMRKSSYLMQLDMSCNEITDEAGHHIATLLFHNLELKELNLSNNFIKKSGAKIIFKGIKVLSYLTKLNIGNNNIIGLSPCDITAVLSQNMYLEEFNLNYDLEASGTAQIFINVKNFIGLIKIKIGNIGMTDLAVNHIADILNNSMKLKQLDLSYNNLYSTDIKSVFSKLNISHLNKINISNNKIGEEVADDIGNFLSKNTKLEELDISCNSPGIKEICKRITGLSNLIKLKIGSNNFNHLAVDDVATVLFHNTKLQEIDLSDNNLLAAGTVSIFNALKNIFTLTSVNISHNWITNEAADDIGAVLSQNIYLKELYLANNYLESNGIITLCKGMNKILYLTNLDMSCNKITDEAAQDVATFILVNHHLKELNLSDNLIQAPGATTILSNCLHLTKINICKNAITDEAANTIAKFISQSTKLKEFDVSTNYLQAVGAVKIFRAITKSNLQKLSINNNLINDGAAEDIISVLPRITKSMEINLENNKLTPRTIHDIASEISNYKCKLSI